MSWAGGAPVVRSSGGSPCTGRRGPPPHEERRSVRLRQPAPGRAAGPVHRGPPVGHAAGRLARGGVAGARECALAGHDLIATPRARRRYRRLMPRELRVPALWRDAERALASARQAAAPAGGRPYAVLSGRELPEPDGEPWWRGRPSSVSATGSPAPARRDRRHADRGRRGAGASQRLPVPRCRLRRRLPVSAFDFGQGRPRPRVRAAASAARLWLLGAGIAVGRTAAPARVPRPPRAAGRTPCAGRVAGPEAWPHREIARPREHTDAIDRGLTPARLSPPFSPRAPPTPAERPRAASTARARRRPRRRPRSGTA